MNKFEKDLKDKISFTDQIISKYSPSEEGMQKLIIEAMNYSVKAGGKRLRPIMLFETLKLFGGSEKEAEPFMAALEMIHTYSLVHDDLPAMDNDEYRRGQKTTHIVFGENIGILTGDALLNYAFEIMSRAVVESENTAQAARALNIIAKKAGIFGMIGGQTVDVLNEGKELTLDTIDFIYNLKTAALIEASMMSGAVLANASEEDVIKVEKIANYVGVAFQIQDDILDVISTMEVLGKPVLSDEKNKKTTYVTLMGIEESQNKVKEYSDRAIELLDSIECENEFLKELIINLINRKK